MNAGAMMASGKCHWLPFKNWGRIIGYADNEGVISQMKLVGDRGFSQAVTMTNFYVDRRERFKYGLRMSNYPQVRAAMCNNDNNCFASPDIGFSTVDKDRDSYSSHCVRSYGNPGWWQAHCHYHHMTGGGVDNCQFAGCQGSDKRNQGTKHWTWYVR